MTFNPASALSILKILSTVELPDRNLAVDFGSQRYTAQHIFPADNVRDFYLKNGFKDYASFDVNDVPHNIKMDLNEPVDSNYRGIASIVTNIGVGEHIFDQCAVFTNMHNVCKVGGVMFFHLPFTPWLNHGFYNFNPILFPALAYANQYDMLFLNVCDRDGNILPVPYETIVQEKGQTEFEYWMMEQLASKKIKMQFVCCTFQKKIDAPFKKPFQGKYRDDIKDDQILQRYV